MATNQTVLFLCTGNYYRSRYAEILFNWHAAGGGLAWEAQSRGLDPDPRNAGPMSVSTMAALRKLGIPFDSHLRLPIRATAATTDAWCIAKSTTRLPITQARGDAS